MNYLDAAKCIQTNLFKSPCLIFDLLFLMVGFTIVSKPTSPKHYIQVIQYDLVQQWERSAIRIYFIHAFSTPIIRRTFEPSEKILRRKPDLKVGLIISQTHLIPLIDHRRLQHQKCIQHQFGQYL